MKPILPYVFTLLFECSAAYYYITNSDYWASAQKHPIVAFGICLLALALLILSKKLFMLFRKLTFKPQHHSSLKKDSEHIYISILENLSAKGSSSLNNKIASRAKTTCEKVQKCRNELSHCVLTELSRPDSSLKTEYENIFLEIIANHVTLSEGQKHDAYLANKLGIRNSLVKQCRVELKKFVKTRLFKMK
jgi:hypothetical protein